MATVNVTPGIVWTSGETVTPTKLNSAATPAVTATLTDGEVTNAKLATGIDAGKLTVGTLPIARIADGAVTNAKLATGIDAAKITAGTLPIARIADGAVNNAKLADGAVGAAKLSGAQTGNAPIFGVRAAGAMFLSTAGILTSNNTANIASVVRQSEGFYRFNFTTPMPNETFAAVASPNFVSTPQGIVYISNRNENWVEVNFKRRDTGANFDPVNAACYVVVISS